MDTIKWVRVILCYRYKVLDLPLWTPTFISIISFSRNFSKIVHFELGIEKWNYNVIYSRHKYFIYAALVVRCPKTFNLKHTTETIGKSRSKSWPAYLFQSFFSEQFKFLEPIQTTNCVLKMTNTSTNFKNQFIYCKWLNYYDDANLGGIGEL